MAAAKVTHTRPVDASSAALAMLTAALWGGTPVAISFSVVSLPPVAVAGVRFAMAAAFMLVWCRLEKCPLRLEAGQFRLVLTASFLLFLQISTFNVGVQWSNSSHASLLINTFVFWVMGLEHFVSKSDRVTPLKLLGLLFAAAGAFLVVYMSQDAEAGAARDMPTLAGDLVLLLSALLLGLRFIYVKQALKQIEPGKLIFWHDVVGVLMFAACSAALEEVSWARMTWPAAWGLIYQGVLVAGLCFAIQAQLLRKHSASQIAVFSFTTPLFGVAFAALLREDPVSPWLVLSVLCIAIGILLVNVAQRTAERAV
jgi:drug/metabolite transporter (DMT)-like permease